MPTQKKTTIGGQAIIEGIVMKGPKKVCTVVRKADGELVIKDADGEIISDGENPVFSVSDGSASTDIVNTTTPKLPETGGIGTGIFYGVGAMLMAGGVLTMIIRRRQRSIHE